jgi:hypothetical protein
MSGAYPAGDDAITKDSPAGYVRYDWGFPGWLREI